MIAKERMPYIIIIILAFSLILLTVFAINNEKKEIQNLEPDKVYVDKDTGEILSNFSRASAVNKLNEILINVGKDSEDRKIKDRLELIEKDNIDMKDVLSKDVIDNLYLEEEFQENKFNRKFTASSLLVLNQVITDVTENEIKPIIKNYDEIVYFDDELLNAHIPLDVFVGNSTGISMEMVYIDGEWKLNPYTSMMSLNLMSILSQPENK